MSDDLHIGTNIEGLSQEDLKKLESAFKKLAESPELSDIVKKATDAGAIVNVNISEAASLKATNEKPQAAVLDYIDAPFAARWSSATC